MSKLVREAGGFYYKEDGYGHREPVNVSLGTEVTDGLIEGFPIAFKISVVIFKFIWIVFAKLRNMLMLEEDAERFLNFDAKIRVNYGSGFIGGLMTILAISLLWDVAVIEIVYSLVKRIAIPIISLIKKSS